jgi:hypothetical protein
MVIFAAPLALVMVEDWDMLFRALLVVRAMHLIMGIQASTIQNLDAKFISQSLIQNALQVIQES